MLGMLGMLGMLLMSLCMYTPLLQRICQVPQQVCAGS
jgi:hypothetical protein